MEIQQFMWPFQHVFRRSVQSLAKSALSSIGVEVAPQALLIGFHDGTEEAPWPICIEPESGPFSPAVFEDIEQRAQEQYSASDDARRFHTDARSNERFHRDAIESQRIELIQAAMNQGGGGSGQREFFVGRPGHVSSFRVYPVVSVLRDRWQHYPRLRSDQTESGVTTTESLQKAVLRHVLGEATRAMMRREPPEGFHFVDRQDAADVIRHALADFIARLSFVHGSWNGQQLADAMEAVAAQPYEGRTGVGTVLLARNNHPSVRLSVEFLDPIPINRIRSFRKALEMTGPDLYLISDGDTIRGLGEPVDSYAAEDESRFLLKVVGRGSWELHHERTTLVRVDNGLPTTPRERISRETFIDTVIRVLGAESNTDELWQLTLAAARQQHGTMLVIRADAAQEAQRLHPQALAITPRPIDASALLAMSAIDGAILSDADGLCHALGVILDGQAVAGEGDAARGARYNSAVRYHHAAEPGTCVIVIISEDGMIDLLPRLRRRVSRASVAAAVETLVRVSNGSGDFEASAAAVRHVEALAFYLSEEQCTSANAARERIERAREEQVLASGMGGITHVGYTPFAPDPTMDQSYWLD